jgi:hypothetical protein
MFMTPVTEKYMKSLKKMVGTNPMRTHGKGRRTEQIHSLPTGVMGVVISQNHDTSRIEPTQPTPLAFTPQPDQAANGHNHPS